MDSLIRLLRKFRIAVGVDTGPSVIVNRRVMWIGSVSNVMAQNSGIVDDSCFNPFALFRIVLSAPQPKLNSNAPEQFQDSIWNKTGLGGFLLDLDHLLCIVVPVDPV